MTRRYIRGVDGEGESSWNNGGDGGNEGDEFHCCKVNECARFRWVLQKSKVVEEREDGLKERHRLPRRGIWSEFEFILKGVLLAVCLGPVGR